MRDVKISVLTKSGKLEPTVNFVISIELRYKAERKSFPIWYFRQGKNKLTTNTYKTIWLSLMNRTGNKIKTAKNMQCSLWKTLEGCHSFFIIQLSSVRPNSALLKIRDRVLKKSSLTADSKCIPLSSHKNEQGIIRHVEN